jgi:hypothetical protein
MYPKSARVCCASEGKNNRSKSRESVAPPAASGPKTFGYLTTENCLISGPARLSRTKEIVTIDDHLNVIQLKNSMENLQAAADFGSRD